MKLTPLIGALALGAVFAAGTAPASAAVLVGPPPAVSQQGTESVVVSPSSEEARLELVQYWRGRPYYGPPRLAYRPWYRRPYYGTIIAGVALGTIIGVTAYGLAPRPPRPDLCWYWADPTRSRGYWDYC
jgi:hypothetical protein